MGFSQENAAVPGGVSEEDSAVKGLNKNKTTMYASLLAGYFPRMSLYFDNLKLWVSFGIWHIAILNLFNCHLLINNSWLFTGLHVCQYHFEGL